METTRLFTNRAEEQQHDGSGRAMCDVGSVSNLTTRSTKCREGTDHSAGGEKGATSYAAITATGMPASSATDFALVGSKTNGEVERTLDDKASLAVVMFNVLLIDTARSIFFSTMWPRIEHFGGNNVTLGYCVGAFSLGRVIMPPVFGRQSLKYGYRKVFMFAASILIVASIAYAAAKNNFEVFLSQLLLGVGSGTLGMTRAYVADKTTKAQRTTFLAYTSAVQYFGLTCMPLLGGYLSYVLGTREIPICGSFVLLTQYTAAAFVLVAAGVIMMALLYFVFKDVTKAVDNHSNKSTNNNASIDKMSAARSEDAITADMSDRDEPWPPAHNTVKPKTASFIGPSLSQHSFSDSSTASGRVDGVYVDTFSDDEARQQEAGRAVVAGTASHNQQWEEEQKLMMLGDRTQQNIAAENMTATLASPEGDDGGYYHAVLSTHEDDAAITHSAAAVEAGLTGHGGLEAGSGSPSSSSSSSGCWARFVGCLGRVPRLVGCGCRMPTHGEMLIYGGLLLNVTTKGTIACFETLGAEYAITRFGFTSAKAASTFATFGAMGVFMLLSMRVLCKYCNDVQLVLGGVSLMTVTCLIFVTSPAGADGLLAFHVAVFLIYSVGYPVGHTAVLSLFSKVVGAQPQVTLMGWFGSAGALSRTVFPVFAGVVTQMLGTSALFAFLAILLCATVGMLFIFREPYLECVETTNGRTGATSEKLSETKA